MKRVVPAKKQHQLKNRILHNPLFTLIPLQMASSNTKGLNIVYLNARSIIKRKEELQENLRGIDIFACVES